MNHTTNYEEQKAILVSAHQNYEKALRMHSSFKIKNPELAQDLVQDTFMKTWSYLAKGRKIDKMKSFLYHVLDNLIIDEYRKRKNTLSLDALMEKGFEPEMCESDVVCNMIDGKTAMAQIKDLPIKYQNVVKMRYVKNYSLQEISHRTHQSVNTVSVQIHRGLEQFKTMYLERSGGF